MEQALDRELGLALRHLVERAQRIAAYGDRLSTPTNLDPGSAFWVEYIQLKAAIHHLDELRLRKAEQRRGVSLPEGA